MSKLIRSQRYDLEHIGVCSVPGSVVRGADSLKTELNSGVDMVFMDLDSSVKFYFICSEVCPDLERFWDVFPVQFSPYYCEMWEHSMR